MNDWHVFADDEELDEPLRIAVDAIRAERVPEDAIFHARERARRLAETAIDMKTRRAARLMRYAGFAAAVMVSAVVAFWAIGLVNNRPALAVVLATVQEQAWIRVTLGDNDTSQRVVWYSPQKDVSAWRDAEWIEYHDHALRVYYSYDVDEEILYRVPEFTARRTSQYATWATALQSLLREEQLAKDPHEQIDLLGNKRSEMQLVDQILEPVEEDGRRWLDYRLTLRHRERPDTLMIVFRVDPQTKLPRSYRMEGKWNGTLARPIRREHLPGHRVGKAFVHGVDDPAILSRCILGILHLHGVR